MKRQTLEKKLDKLEALRNKQLSKGDLKGTEITKAKYFKLLNWRIKP